MDNAKIYVGIDQDQYGGMTAMGAIVKDAWVFGIIPETETCAGWTLPAIQMLYDKTRDHWEKYGYLVRNLPPDLRERHERIYGEALRKAKELGWEPDMYGEE